jgi:hypothetical protein
LNKISIRGYSQEETSLSAMTPSLSPVFTEKDLAQTSQSAKNKNSNIQLPIHSVTIEPKKHIEPSSDDFFVQNRDPVS